MALVSYRSTNSDRRQWAPADGPYKYANLAIDGSRLINLTSETNSSTDIETSGRSNRAKRVSFPYAIITDSLLPFSHYVPSTVTVEHRGESRPNGASGEKNFGQVRKTEPKQSL